MFTFHPFLKWMLLSMHSPYLRNLLIKFHKKRSVVPPQLYQQALQVHVKFMTASIFRKFCEYLVFKWISVSVTKILTTKLYLLFSEKNEMLFIHYYLLQLGLFLSVLQKFISLESVGLRTQFFTGKPLSYLKLQFPANKWSVVYPTLRHGHITFKCLSNFQLVKYCCNINRFLSSF